MECVGECVPEMLVDIDIGEGYLFEGSSLLRTGELGGEGVLERVERGDEGGETELRLIGEEELVIVGGVAEKSLWKERK